MRSVSLVGYTNAGKSTLLNALTNADALVENRLFATLDPRTRRLVLPGGEAVLCSDTVGFVSKLPHQLVESFHATLEVVADSDLLVHVVDVSARDPEAQMEAVRKVLVEIGADGVEELIVLNKADAGAQSAERFHRLHRDSVVISAPTSRAGRAVRQLLAIDCAPAIVSSSCTFLTPAAMLLAALHRRGDILGQSDDGNGSLVTVRLAEEGRRRFAEYLVTR